MYAGMTTTWYQATSKTATPTVNDTLPLFLVLFSSDKGTEKITDMTADEFFNMYGTYADFFKYGQPLLQAHNILNKGGRILGKRIVSNTATLANLVICAEVVKKAKQKTNAQGQALYIDSEGHETTEVTENPININYASVKYVSKTIANVTDTSNTDGLDAFQNVLKQADALNSESNYVLFVIADNGRGKSIKKVRIVPDYAISRNLSYCMYNLYDIENTKSIDPTRFSIDPTAKYTSNNQIKSMILTENSTTQFRTSYNEKGFNAFLDKIAEITGYSKEELLKNDVLFGKTVKNANFEGIDIDPAGINLSHQYGIELPSGTNGEFGDNPYLNGEATEAWEKEAVKFASGEVTDAIYDLDLYKIDFIVDANYPKKLKNALHNLNKFRQDASFFRDYGRNIWSYDDVYTYNTELPKSAFTNDYLSTYEIIDPYSKKQIRVTYLYHMAGQLVDYFSNNLSAPLAGEFNGFTVTDFIPGTLNFSPKVTPRVDQKSLLDDLRVNFVNYSSYNTLVTQSLYTSDPNYGPLSFANNVIITQMALKAVRNYTPKIRFMLVDGDDFGKYKELIQDNVLSAFKAYFSGIELIYTADADFTTQKIFHASLRCWYKNFSQSEDFDIFAIDGSYAENSDLSEYNISKVE